MRCDRAIYGTTEVRSDLVGSPLVRVMTGLTLLEYGFASLGVGLGEQLVRSEPAAAGAASPPPAAGASSATIAKPSFFGALGMEDSFRRDGDRHQNENRSEQRPHCRMIT